MPFVTKSVAKEYDVIAPDGSEIRLLPILGAGSMAHVTLRPNQVSVAITHKTVEEIWYVLSGKGEMWRKHGDKESITPLEPGCSLTIPLGTHFQFRNLLKDPLKLILITMPPWPGNDEATQVPGHWSAED